jgi:uncharacterized protein DUF6883
MVGEPLPRAREAFIPDDKLEGYILSPEHPRGKHKARVFASALGIHRSDAGYLEVSVLEAIQTAPVTAVKATHPMAFFTRCRYCWRA